MKKNYLFLIVFLLIAQMSNAQVKKSTTVKKPAAKTSTTVKKPATKTTVKKAVPQPVATPTEKIIVPVKEEYVAPAPVIEEKPAGPPVTGPANEGPKSYENNTTKQKANSTTKTKTVKEKTVREKVVKEKAPKKIRENTEGTRSYIGIRGGYNQSSFEGAADLLMITKDFVKPLGGLQGGLVLNIGLSKAISIQLEGLYSQQGLRVQDADIYSNAMFDMVNVPLMLKIAVGSPRIKFFINAGGYGGYLLNQKLVSNATGTVETINMEFDKEYNASGEKDNRIDFGAIGGAGLQFNLGGPLLTLEGRYQYGFADPILYKDGKPADVGSKGHTRVMTGTVGLLFPIGRK